MFFFNIFNAFVSNFLAIITSKKVLCISLANFSLILKLQATTPPKALTGSLANVFSNDNIGVFADPTPQGFACLTITVPKLFGRVETGQI